MAEGELFSTILRLTLALAAGGLVGLERSFHGRPAGFREHTLVCISSCMLSVGALFQRGGSVGIQLAAGVSSLFDQTKFTSQTF